MSDKDFCLGIRQAVLMFLDVFERWLQGREWFNGPRTAELRKEAKRQ